jgi:TetR/AcrR family transcriptional regulator, regulator of autoinduction and epiphytic fitness
VRAPNPAEQPTIDGRAARSARTREAVVRALLALIAEGDLRPTAGRIAERAGISLRSVYVHFEDLDDLFVAASLEQRTRVAGIIRILPATGPFERRLESFVDQRARVLELVAPVAKATALHEPFSPALAAASKSARQLGRAELVRVFATELADLDPTIRDHAADACDALTNSDTWDVLRVRRGLTFAEAAAAISTALRLLLRTEATTTARQRARRWRVRPPGPPDGSVGEERR